LSVWHGNLRKKKSSGGKKHHFRTKRRFERGSFPTETLYGEPRKKIDHRRGGIIKIRLLNINQANVSNLSTGKNEKVEIIRVARNPANVDYSRRGVITKGTIIETTIGMAQIKSRPGQDGIINAVLMTKAD
jgi:small subunit ribosomal protein S8e